MGESEPNEVTTPETLLESFRGVAESRKFRLFAIACCRHVWTLLPDDCRATVMVAEDFVNHRVDETARTRAKSALKVFYVDGDSSPEDRLFGFSNEAAANTVYGDHDYPPISTYATTCAIAAAFAAVEVVIADCELQGGSDHAWEERASAEARWQCEKIREIFQ